MQTQDFTVYAVRILAHLHEHQDSVQTGVMIAKSVGISYHSFLRIALCLKRKSLLLSTAYDRKGSYVLGRSLHETSLQDVFSCFEDDLQANHFLRDPIRDAQGKIIEDIADISRVEMTSGLSERLYGVETMDKKIHMIPIDEIILIQPSPQQGILELHQEYGLLVFRGKISRVEVNIPEFFRSHISVVVNVNHIKTIDVEKREITLTNDRLVPIAKQKIPVLLSLMATGDGDRGLGAG